jgi:ParB-like nuclease domain
LIKTVSGSSGWSRRQDEEEKGKMEVGIEKGRACRASSVGLVAAIRGGEQRDPLHTVCHKIEVVQVSQLVPYKANARTHSREQIRKIAESIKRFGFCNPILIDDNYQLIAGHGRVEAAKILGLTEVPVLRLSHLSDVEKRSYLIADNRLAELAGWDRDVLAIELAGLLDANFNVELTGFDIGEVDIILEEAKDDSDQSADPGKPISHPVVSQGGDQWLLGEHRLVCGNAGQPGVYASADHAIRSWQTFAGRPATLAGTAKTFAQVEKERKSARDQSAPSKREAA